MDFTYEATGGMNIFGCSDYKLVHYKYYQYAIGSILFNKHKASRGVYEKVAIKSVKFPDKYTNLYVDTFNALWNEDELVPYSVAVDLANSYIILRNKMYEEAARLCKN